MNQRANIPLSERRLVFWGQGNLLDNTVPLLTGIRILSLRSCFCRASGTASPFTPGQAEVRWRKTVSLLPGATCCSPPPDHHLDLPTGARWLIGGPWAAPGGNPSSFLHQPEYRPIDMGDFRFVIWHPVPTTWNTFKFCHYNSHDPFCIYMVRGPGHQMITTFMSNQQNA